MDLVSYLFVALLTWVGLPAKDPQVWEANHFEKTDAAMVRIHGIAEDISGVVDQDVEKGTQLGAVAFEESGLQRYVDDGTCNLQGQIRQLHRLELAHGTCDNGRAYTIWQIWPRLGERVDRVDSWTVNRQAAAWKAMVLWEKHPEQWTTKARAVARAKSWLATHPFGGASASL